MILRCRAEENEIGAVYRPNPARPVTAAKSLESCHMFLVQIPMLGGPEAITRYLISLRALYHGFQE